MAVSKFVRVCVLGSKQFQGASFLALRNRLPQLTTRVRVRKHSRNILKNTYLRIVTNHRASQPIVTWLKELPGEALTHDLS